MRTAIELESKTQEVTAQWAGVSLLAQLLTVVASLAWFGRLP